MRRYAFWIFLSLFVAPLMVAANPIRGESEAEYPAAVRAAIMRLRCHCSCAHTLHQCNHSPAKAEMQRLHQERGLDEEALVAWYKQTYAEEARRFGKNDLMLTLPGQGLGRTLEYFIGGAVLLSLAVMWLVIARSRRRSIVAAPESYVALSEDDERRLEEMLRRA